jgi:dipeptidyl aminopeptidase/acylaminoacyl peptidase
MVTPLALMLVATAAAAGGTPATPAGGGDPSCGHILPPVRAATGTRPLGPEDLLRLRDIGPADAESFAAPLFTISPDGRRVAFQLRQADPAGNDYCLAMVVLDLVPGASPRIVDQGGELRLLTIDNAGTADFPTGIPEPITPLWSPDGSWIAFLKRSGGRTQVWRAATDGSGSFPVTNSPVDVVDFRIEDDGKSVAFATRAEVTEAKREIEREGLSGYHFDSRWAPVDANHPLARPPAERTVRVADLASGRVRDPTPAERAMLADGGELIATGGAAAHGRPGARAWVAATTLSGGAERGGLRALAAGRSVLTCSKAACDGATDPWLMEDGHRVRFMKREGWAGASTAIYEWDLASGSVKRLYVTDDVLADCAPWEARLVCLRDSSVQPRRLELLDPSTGARQLLFDPNPEFAALTLGKVERLHWRNSFGIEAIGDLVLPVGYRRTRRYPLVVVQYQTRGFLRGGTGDEYPIQAFANRGYAVLSVQRPIPVAIALGARTFHEGDRLNLSGFADQKSVFSSLERGVRIAIARGIADPRKIGISGLSNGSTTAVWALLHSSLFSAAALSSCCFDTDLAMWVGPVTAKEYREDGYPGLLGHNSPFWRDIALSINARRVRTPILLQLADYEYLNSLESYTALREAGAPIDMFVFPGEYHNKWQPAHRLAVYRRSLDWFDYWLRGIRPAAPDRKADLESWDKLRAQLPSASRS